MFDPTTVDYLAVDPESESIVLGMIQAEEFDESKRQAELLVEKVRNYLEFYDSGQVLRHVKGGEGLGLRIHFDHFEPLPATVHETLNRVGLKLLERKVALTTKLVEADQ